MYCNISAELEFLLGTRNQVNERYNVLRAPTHRHTSIILAVLDLLTGHLDYSTHLIVITLEPVFCVSEYNHHHPLHIHSQLSLKSQSCIGQYRSPGEVKNINRIVFFLPRKHPISGCSGDCSRAPFPSVLTDAGASWNGNSQEGEAKKKPVSRRNGCLRGSNPLHSLLPSGITRCVTNSLTSSNFPWTVNLLIYSYSWPSFWPLACAFRLSGSLHQKSLSNVERFRCFDFIAGCAGI